MKFGTFRPLSVMLPLAMLAAIPVAGTEFIAGLFLCYTLLTLTSLNAPGCYRNASYTEPGTRRVDARFLGSCLQTVVGTFLLFIVLKFLPDIPSISISATITAVLLMFEQLFEERMFAIGRKTDSTLLSIVSSILLCGGIMLGYPVPAGCIALLVALIVTFVNQPLKFRKVLPNIAFAPRTLLQDAALPVILALMSIMLHSSMYALLPAWGIGRVFRSFARCSEDETRKPRMVMNLLLMTASIAALMFPISSELIPLCASIVLTYMIGFSLDLRTLISSVLLIICGVLSYLNLPIYAAAASFVSCIVVFDRRVLLRKV